MTLSDPQQPIAVLGAGSWGTTLALVLNGKGLNVRLWEFRQDAVERLRADRENKEFLPGIPLPESLEIHHDARECLADAQVVLLAIPSQFVRGALLQMTDFFPRGAIIINAAKGIEEITLMRPSEVVEEIYPGTWPDRYVALSGPSHAEEVSRGIPTTVV
ncbi:NAD(P)-binding domain-containing protein, partial [bacterium]|nr:NAD(P)-binding domain-containing protein [bacterium]